MARGVRRTRPSSVLTTAGYAGDERTRDEWSARRPARRNAVQMAKSDRRPPSLAEPCRNDQAPMTNDQQQGAVVVAPVIGFGQQGHWSLGYWSLVIRSRVLL